VYDNNNFRVYYSGEYALKIYKRTILRLFFAIEIVIFVGVYLFGGNGLQYLTRLKSENSTLYFEILSLKKDISNLEKQIEDWQSNDFYKEKYARERLQMAKKGEVIYFLDAKNKESS